MKKINQLLVSVLVLALVMSLSSSAFAKEIYSSTIGIPGISIKTETEPLNEEDEPEEALPDEEQVTDVPVEENPDETVPTEEGPASDAPADEAPAAEVPVEEGPAAEVPAEEGPAADTPADEVPVEEAEIPDENTPVEEAPAGEKYAYFTSTADGKEVLPGDSITLTAHVGGFEGIDYEILWQYSPDGVTGHDAGRGNTYTYTVTEENIGYLWGFLIVTPD